MGQPYAKQFLRKTAEPQTNPVQSKPIKPSAKQMKPKNTVRNEQIKTLVGWGRRYQIHFNQCVKSENIFSK